MFDIAGFKSTVGELYGKALSVSEKQASVVLSEEKWSLKEILGHLIDSASNNQQRFVRLQSDDLLGFPPYDGEKWIKVQKYNSMNWDSIVLLWYNYNLLLLNIIENVDCSKLGNVWVKDEDAITLESLINDYYRHIRTHIKHFDDRLKEISQQAG